MSIINQNPYVGPRTFLKEEGHLFFGRDRESRDLAALVASEKLVLFYAQSGAGKSSLINTRLIPDLEQKLFEVLRVARLSGDAAQGIGVENIYIYNLIRSLLHRDTDPQLLSRLTLSQFLEKLNEDENGYFYDQDLAIPIRANASITPWPRALIIDQFEEIFSANVEAWQKREDFFCQLAQAMQDDPYLWVIIVMREDYIAALDPYAHLLPGGLRVRYYMQRLSHEAAIKAVRSPVEKLRPYAEGVAEKLVEDLSSVLVQKPDGATGFEPGQYIEPVQLQVVCYGLWEDLSPDGVQITEKDLQEIGDVNQSLGKYYDRRVNEVAEAKNVKERLIREWFEKKLITVGGMRNMVLQERETKPGELDDEIIKALQSDLVRAEKRGGATWYELTHDRLVEPILERNKIWFTEHLSPLQRQAALWKDQNENESWLLSDQALVEVEQWAKDHADELSDVEIEFLKACKKKQIDKDQQEKLISEQRLARQRRLVTNISIAVTIVMLALVIFAFRQSKEAEIAAARAQTQTNIALTAQADAEANRIKAVDQTHFARGNQLAVQSQAVVGIDNQLSLLLALESLKEANQGGESRLPLAEDVLRRTIEQVGSGIPLYGHTGLVSAVVISPDGHWLASGSDDYTLRLWDMTAQDPSANPIVHYTDSCQTVTLVFNPKGNKLAIGCNDGTVRLWDGTAEDPSADPIVLVGHSDYIYSLTFSPNGEWLASGSRDTTIRLWDMTAKNPSANPIVLSGQTGLILTLAFSPNGDWLASGSDDSTVRLWNMTAKDPSATPMVFSGHTGIVNFLTFSPNGSWLASGSDDATVRLWNMTSKDPSADPIVLYTDYGSILSLAFSPNGNWLAGGGSDSIVRLWDMNAQDISASLSVLPGHSDWIRDLAFSIDGRWLASCSYDSTVRLWDMNAQNPSINPIVLRGPGSVQFLAFSPDGHWLVSAGDDATPRLWDISAQSELLKPEQEISSYEMIVSLGGHTKGINALSFSPDGYQLASASDDTTVRLWNFQTGLPNEANNILQSAYGSGPVNTLLFQDSYGEWFAGTGNNKMLLLYLSERSLFEESIPLVGHEGSISVLAINKNSDLLAVPNNTNYSIELWNGDLYFLQQPLVLIGHKGIIHTMAFSPDNRWLASAGDDAAIILWNLEDLHTISPLFLKGQTGDVYAVAFSPDGRWLASAGSDTTVRLWDMSKDAPSEATYILRGHQGTVHALAFSPGGRWLASAGDDSTIRLWDMANPSVEPIVLHGNTESISALTFSPGGHWLVSGGSSKNLQIMGPSMEALKLKACKIANRNLTWQEWREYFKNIPYEKTCADFPVHPSVVSNLVDEGDQLARSGDIEGAIIKYRAAREFDSIIDLRIDDFFFDFSSVDDFGDPKTRANGLAVLALIKLGDNFSQAGNVDDAVARYREALAVDPTISDDLGDPDARAKGFAAQALIGIGDSLAQAGDIEAAVAKYREALAVDPTISNDLGDPDARAKGFAAQVLIDTGDSLVQGGDIEGAISTYLKALAIDPSIGDSSVDSEARAKSLVAQVLIDIGDSFAQGGDVEGAIAKYVEALTFDNTISINIGNPETRANNLSTAQPLKDEISLLTDAGEYQEAVSKFETVQGIAPGVFTLNDVEFLNNLCWNGSLAGYAQDVKNACNLAVELAPTEGYIVDSLGLNRALLGDFKGAIEDFEYAAIWFRRNGYAEHYAVEREAWIVVLKNNQNPFNDPANMEIIRNE